MRTHEEVSSTRNRQRAEERWSALADRRRSDRALKKTKVNLTAPAIKERPFTGRFFYGNPGLLMRTHNKAVLNNKNRTIILTTP
jgi:hypothetical protein